MYIKLGDNEIQKQNVHHKGPISIKNIEKI